LAEFEEEARKNRELVVELRKRLKAAEDANRYLTSKFQTEIEAMKEEHARAKAWYEQRIKELEAELRARAPPQHGNQLLDQLRDELTMLRKKCQSAVEGKATAEDMVLALQKQMAGMQHQLRLAEQDRMNAEVRVSDLQRMVDELSARRTPWTLHEMNMKAKLGVRM